MDLLKKDIENCGLAIENYCRYRAGEHKDYTYANEIRESWKKIKKIIENFASEGFLKND